MSVTGSEKEENLGFITVIDHVRFGLVGGYLILNPVGRPVEFHCTAPVRANRAQEILFGNTLKTYLYGEQIAQVLIRKAKSPVLYVITDTPEVLAAQDFVQVPVVLVKDQQKNNDYDESENGQAQLHPIKSVVGLNPTKWKEITCPDSPINANAKLWLPVENEQGVTEISEQLSLFAKLLDFTEPFTRIVLALEEAQKSAA
ncbi:MAG: hypothetical protein ACRC2T_06700 [Thermoguttaceae bacterium]